MSKTNGTHPQVRDHAKGQPRAQSLATMTDIQQERLSNEIALLDEARVAIEKATTVKEAKEVKDRAEAIEIYAKRVEYGEILQQRCVEIRLRAERKAGELLTQEKLARGGRPADPETGHSRVTGLSEETTLGDLGLTKNQSYKWQKIAAIPEAAFEDAVAAAQSEADLLRLASKLNAPPKPPPPPPPRPPMPPEPGQRPVDPSPFAPDRVKRKCFCQGDEIVWAVDLGAYEALYEVSKPPGVDNLGDPRSIRPDDHRPDSAQLASGVVVNKLEEFLD